MVRSIATRTRAPAVVLAGVSVLILTVFSDRSDARATQAPCYAAAAYPGDTAPRAQIARWMATAARAAGLPPELPVMASLVESGLRNRKVGSRGQADSVGFFQMRTSIWNNGEYKGYPSKPELQLKWFIDSATAVKMQRYARRAGDLGADPSSWGEWIADVEKPVDRVPGRYQLQLDAVRSLLTATTR